eukprot:291136-Rhodomonas_salina.1
MMQFLLVPGYGPGLLLSDRGNLETLGDHGAIMMCKVLAFVPGYPGTLLSKNIRSFKLPLQSMGQLGRDVCRFCGMADTLSLLKTLANFALRIFSRDEF